MQCMLNIIHTRDTMPLYSLIAQTHTCSNMYSISDLLCCPSTDVIRDRPGVIGLLMGEDLDGLREGVAILVNLEGVVPLVGLEGVVPLVALCGSS